MEALKENKDYLGAYYELYEILRCNESIATALQCFTKCKLNHSLIVKHLDLQKFTYIGEHLDFVYNDISMNELKEIVIYTNVYNKKVENVKNNKQDV